VGLKPRVEEDALHYFGLIEAHDEDFLRVRLGLWLRMRRCGCHVAVASQHREDGVQAARPPRYRREVIGGEHDGSHV
jgi:hypothetical protein